MSESLQTQLLRSSVHVTCPHCTYDVWIRLSEVVVETTVRCPCCRNLIKLVNQDASASHIGDDIESMLDDAFKDLF